MIHESKGKSMGKSSIELTKVEVLEDIQINGQEIVRKGAIGYIDYNTIYFPDGGVDNLPKDVDPKYVRYDYNDFWEGKIKAL